MEILVLGPLEVIARGRKVPLGGPRQRAVLAVLVAEVGRIVSVDHLVESVWGDEPPDGATATLQSYISALRKALEPDRAPGHPPTVLITRAPGYSLDLPPEAVDAIRFDRLAAAGRNALDQGDQRLARERLEEALALWRGEPYADLAYAEFARTESERLNEVHHRVVEDLVEARLALGHHGELVAELEPLVTRWPLRERLRGQLMVALYRSGRQADALRVMAEGRTLLTEELGLDPGPELRRLERRILEQDPTLEPPGAEPATTVTTSAPAPAAGAPAPTTPSPVSGRDHPLVGRDAELAAGTAALTAAVAGTGATLVLTGEAGIGKTTMATELADRARAMGCTTTIGRARAVAGTPPLWPWIEVVRDLVEREPQLAESIRCDADLAAVAPDPIAPAHDGTRLAVDVDAARFRLADALGRFFGQATRPALVAIEDLQWADVGTLVVAELLAPRLTAAPVVLVVTAREPHPPAPALDHLLATLAREPSVTRFRLAPLGRLDTDRLVRAAGLDLPASEVDRLADRTGGNPFFLAELLRHRRLGRERSALPETVRDVVRERVAALPEPAREWLTLGCYAFDDFGVSVVPQTILGLDLDTQVEAAEACCAAGLVHEVPGRPGRYRFAHALVRQALSEDQSAIRWARTHLALGDLLEHEPGYGTEDERARWLGYHFCEAAALGAAARGAAYAAVSGRRALTALAPEFAAGEFARGLAAIREHDVDDPALATELLIGIAEARQIAGDPEAVASAAEAIEAAERLGEPELSARAALAPFAGPAARFGTYGVVRTDVVQRLEQVLADLPDHDSVLRVQLLARLAGELTFDETGGVRREELGVAAVDMARRLDDPAALCIALGALHTAIWSLRTLRRRTAISAELVEVARRAGLADQLAIGRALHLADRLEAAEGVGLVDELEAAAVSAESAGQTVAATSMHWMRANLAQLRGRFDDAEVLAATAYERFARVDPGEALGAYTGFIASLRWDQGRLAELEPQLRAELDAQPHLAFSWQIALAWFLADQGRLGEATDVLDGLELDRRDDLPQPALRSGLVASLAEAATLTGHTAAAEAVLRFTTGADARIVIADTGTYWFGALSFFAGSVLAALGRFDDAFVELERARATHEQLGSPTWQARAAARIAWARARRGAVGDREIAHRHLDAAETLARPTGHRGVLDVVDQIRGLLAP